MGIFRSLLLGLSLLAFLVSSLVANVGLWGLSTFLDGRTFATTAARILEQPDVRAVLAGRLADRLTALLVPDPQRIPNVVRRALLGSGAPTVSGIRNALTTHIDTLLADPGVVSIEQDALADLHVAVMGLIAGGAVDTTSAITLDLGGVVAALDTRLDPDAPGFLGAALPPEVGIVTIAQPGGLMQLARLLHLLEAFRWLLPAVAAVTACLVLLLARSRLHALAWLGLCLLVVGAGCLVLASSAPLLLGRVLGGRADSLASTQATIDGLLAGLITQSAIVAGLGLALLVVGVTAGVVTAPDPRGERRSQAR